MKQESNGWIVASIAGLVFSVLFVVVGGLSRGYELRSVTILAISGLLLGAIAAPELEPKAFQFPAAWQVSFGILGGVLFVAANWTNPVEFMAGGAMGGLLGFFAPYWVRYIPVP